MNDIVHDRRCVHTSGHSSKISNGEMQMMISGLKSTEMPSFDRPLPWPCIEESFYLPSKLIPVGILRCNHLYFTITFLKTDNTDIQGNFIISG